MQPGFRPAVLVLCYTKSLTEKTRSLVTLIVVCGDDCTLSINVWPSLETVHYRCMHMQIELITLFIYFTHLFKLSSTGQKTPSNMHATKLFLDII